MHAFFDQMVPCWSAMHAAGLRPPGRMTEQAPPVRARRAIQRWIEALQQSGKCTAAEDAESLSIAIIGAIQTRSFRRHIIRDVYMLQSDEAYVQAVVDFTWRALTTPEEV